MPLSLGSTSWIPSGNGTIRNNDITSVDNGVFIGGEAIGAQAGGGNHIQVSNPAGSGGTVLVDAFWGNLGPDPQCHICRYDVLLTTDVGTGEDINGNGNASLAHIRTETSAALLGTSLSLLSVPDSMGSLTYPIAIADGDGILWRCNQASNYLQMSFIWREV